MCLIYLSWNKLTHYFNHCDPCLNRTTLTLFCFFWNDRYHKCKIVHNSAIFTIKLHILKGMTTDTLLPRKEQHFVIFMGFFWSGWVEKKVEERILAPPVKGC